MKIRNKRQHAEAIQRMEKLMDYKSVKELDQLSIEIEEYERRRWPKYELTPQDAIGAKMEELDITQGRMAYLLGLQPSHFSEFMHGCRNLPIEAVRIAVAEHNVDPLVLLEIN